MVWMSYFCEGNSRKTTISSVLNSRNGTGLFQCIGDCQISFAKIQEIRLKKIMLSYSKLNVSLHFTCWIWSRCFGCDKNTTILILKGLKGSISAVFVTKLWHWFSSKGIFRLSECLIELGMNWIDRFKKLLKGKAKWKKL